MWFSRVFVLGLAAIPLVLVAGLVAQAKPTATTRWIFHGLVLLFAVLMLVALAGYTLSD